MSKAKSWGVIGLGAILAIILIATLFSNTFIKTQPLPEIVDYNFHIRPILSDKCFKCHGPDANKREAGLRLDTKKGAFAVLENSEDVYAIVPGDKNASELFHRITTTDSSALMPPPEANLSLTAREIELIEKWIEQGAEYKKHWAFIPPEKKELPKAKRSQWAKNEIDYFILNELENIDLKPNEEANKERLLKRLSFDLTGLPPSVELQEKFLADNSEDAYEKSSR